MKRSLNLTKLFSLLLVLTLVFGLLVSCGSSSGGDVVENGESQNAAAGLDASAAEQQGKIIVTMTVRAYTDNFDEDYDTLKQELTALGGYIATSNYSYTESSGKSVTATLKIPADKCQEFTDAFSAYLEITSAQVSTEDITVQYIDAESRITALEAELATMNEMLEEETSYDKAIEISKRITELITELEKAKSLLSEYEKRTAYSTVNLMLTEVRSEEEIKEEGFFKRIGRTFGESFMGVVEFFGDLIVFFVGNFPTLFALGLIPFGIVLIAKLSKKRRAKRRANEPTPPPKMPPQTPYPPYYWQRPPQTPYSPYYGQRPPMTPPTTPTPPTDTPTTPSDAPATPSDDEKPE